MSTMNTLQLQHSGRKVGAGRAAWRWGVLLLVALCWSLVSQAATPTLAKLDNGVRLIVLPVNASQVVSVEALVDYSALDESPRMPGIRQVLLTTMLQGSDAMNATAIRRSLTAAGGEFSARAHQDMLEFSVTVPTDALDIALQALAEVIQRPQLTDNGIRWAAEDTRSRMAMSPTSSASYADRLAQQLLFDAHPYGIASANSFDPTRFTPDDVRTAYRQHVVPQATVLSVVGCCDAMVVDRGVRAIFSGWTGEPFIPHPIVEAPTLATSSVELRQESVATTTVMLAFPAPGARDPDFLALRLLDDILSGGTASRLFRGIRESQGLAYETASRYPPQASSSYFVGYAVTNARYMEAVKVSLLEELEQLQTTSVPEDELARAKAFLRGRYLLSHQSSAQYAFDLGWYVLSGVGLGYDADMGAKIEAVTPADIQRVARTWFTHYKLIVITPQSAPAA
jgi:predicted Zn-dependent peptidase